MGDLVTFGVMIRLNTYTKTLSISQVRRIVGLTILWAKKHIGDNNKPLSYTVTIKPIMKYPAYGVYDPDTYKIKISRLYCKNVKLLIQTTLHEYRHHLQDLSCYSEVLDELGYSLHPQEIESRGTELYYALCWKQIKDKI